MWPRCQGQAEDNAYYYKCSVSNYGRKLEYVGACSKKK